MSFIGTEQFCERPVFKFRCRMATAKSNHGRNLFLDYSEDLETPSDDAIKVFLRLKPNTSESNDIVVEDSRTLLFKMPPEFTQSRKKLNIPDNYRYTFSQIFPSDVTQGEIFTGCVSNHIRDLFAGQHCLLFTYGTTNAGKTFTVLGTGEQPGIIPRTLTTVFKSILGREYGTARIKPYMFNSAIEVNDNTLKAEQDFKTRILSWNPDKTMLSDTSKASKSHATTLSSVDELGECVFKQMQKRLTNDTSIVEYEAEPEDRFSVWISFGEIYNEAIYDLLEPLQPNRKRKPLKLAQDRNRNTYIKGLNHIFVQSEEEAYKVLMFGKNNLQVAETGMNTRSSRSHCIFTIKLLKCPNVEHPERVVVSSFSICDLAGAERQKKALNEGLRLKESQNINCSLHVLSRCFSIIRENQINTDQKLVPFRDSKLTRLFQHALLGKESVTMIVNVNSEKHLCEETQHVLKASAIAKHIVVQPRTVKRPPRVTRFSQFVIKHNRSTLIRWDSCVKPKCPDASTLESIHDGDITDISNAARDKQDKYENLLGLVESLKEKLKEEKEKHILSKKTWRQREEEIRKEMREELSQVLEKTKQQTQLDFQREREIAAENGKVLPSKRLRLETNKSEDENGTFECEITELEEEIKMQQKQIEGLTELVNILREEKKELSMELSSAKIKLSWRARDIDNLNKKIEVLGDESQLKREYLDLEKLMESKLKERDILLDEARNDVLEEMRMREDCEEEVEKLEKELAEKEEEIFKLNTVIDDRDQEIDVKTRTLDMGCYENEELLAKLEHYEEENTSLRSKCVTAEQELANKVEELVVLKKQLEENSEARSAALQEELDQFQSERNQAAADRVALLDQLTLKTNELDSCRKEFADKLESQCKSRDCVKENLELARLTINKLQEELFEKTKQIEDVTKVFEGINSKHELTLKEQSELDILNQHLKEEIQEKICEIEKLNEMRNAEKEHTDKLRMALKNKEHELECSQNQIIGYKISVPTFKAQFDRKEKEVAEYKLKCQDFTITIFNLEQENKSFQENQKFILGKYEEQLKKAKDENEVLKKEVAKLTTTFYKSTPTPKKELEKQIKDLKDELQDCKKQLDEALVHCKKLQEDNDSLQPCILIDLTEPKEKIKNVFESEDSVLKTKKPAKLTTASARYRAQSTNSCEKKSTVTADETNKCKSVSRVRTRRTTKPAESPSRIAVSDSDSKPEVKAPAKSLRKKLLYDTSSQVDCSTLFDEVDLSPNLPQESPTTTVRRNLRTRHKENTFVKTNLKNLTHSGKCVGCKPHRKMNQGKSLCRTLFTQDDTALQELDLNGICMKPNFETESPLSIIKRLNRENPL